MAQPVVRGISGVNDGSGSGVYGFSVSGVGLLAESFNNYGIYAMTTNATYAAYFNRSIFVNGSVFTSSDQKLKQNIQDVTSAMDIINQLHPKKYDYRQDGSYKLMKLPQGTHFGLIAQDVEKILPTLVKDTKFETSLEASTKKPEAEGKNDLQQNTKSETIDFKAVNYTELIPIMIKGMQEMQAKIDEQQRKIEELEKKNTSSNTGVISSNSNSAISSKVINAFLKQNSPNPFRQNTAVQYSLPENVNIAQLILFDMNGHQLKSYILNKGMNQLTIDGGALSSGQYIYSLIVDGKKIDSKTMILTK